LQREILRVVGEQGPIETGKLADLVVGPGETRRRSCRRAVERLVRSDRLEVKDGWGPRRVALPPVGEPLADWVALYQAGARQFPVRLRCSHCGAQMMAATEPDVLWFCRAEDPCPPGPGRVEVVPA
jgi:hypothetical protein